MTYLHAIESVGGIPSLIHLTADIEVLRAHYERCDGILFAGGDDVDPSRYGEEPHPHLHKTRPLQDMVELTLAGWARTDEMPLFGVCRGIQLLNVAFGGTLYQDIPSQVEGSFDHGESDKRKEWTYLAHDITIDEHSWLAEQLGATSVAVNTLHHQAIKDIAPGLRIVARASDGVIEAAEGVGRQFVAAVQCHPETLWESADSRWQRVFAAFVRRCQQQ